MTLFLWIALLLWPALLAAQESIPFILGRSPALLAPTVDGLGRTVVFGATITLDGATLDTMDLYVAGADGSGLRRLTRLAGGLRPPQGAMAVSLAANASRAAFTALVSSRGRTGEEVHLVDVATGADRTVAVDTEGCIQPLGLDCPICFFTCVNTPHVSLDGGRVLYSVRRQNPFYVVNADGTGLVRLPVYTGVLAPGPQRVISRNGLVVFSSAAPFGPTFAPSAQDVYLVNLDGTNIRAVTKFGNDASVFAANATISADGGAIAFESNRDPVASAASNPRQVWVVRTDGSGLRALTAGREASTGPSISGDGSLVAFVRGGQIHIVRSDGTGLRALTDFRMSSAQDPVISEDGSRVIFSLGPRDGGRGAIYSVSGDGSNLRAVYAPRALNQNGIIGAVPGSQPSPGSLLSAYGINLAADALATADRFPLPESLAGISLLVNGRPAPLLAVTPWQVNAQLPPEVIAAPAAFQFRFADGAFAAASAAEVKAFAPAIFILPSEPPRSDGVVIMPVINQAAAFHAGTRVPADRANPAVAGEMLEIYGTGLGPTEPFVPAGTAAPVSPPARTLAVPEVLIGERPALVIFSGLVPGLAGVYQVNAIVPFGLRPGQQVVRWRVGSPDSFGFATITVR